MSWQCNALVSSPTYGKYGNLLSMSRSEGEEKCKVLYLEVALVYHQDV